MTFQVGASQDGRAGDISISTGTTNAMRGNLQLLTGASQGGELTPSGSLELRTGDSSQSGNIMFATGNSEGQESGSIQIKSGDASSGSSGGIILSGGVSHSTEGGSIVVQSGASEVATGGKLQLISGSGMASGSIDIATMVGAQESGNVLLQTGSPLCKK